MTDGPRALHVRVTGRVQGVSFRAWTKHQALMLGLRGWVRNERDGSVAALIVGPADAVAEMLALFEEGPLGAVVVDVLAEPTDQEQMPPGFDVRA